MNWFVGLPPTPWWRRALHHLRRLGFWPKRKPRRIRPGCMWQARASYCQYADCIHRKNNPGPCAGLDTQGK